MKVVSLLGSPRKNGNSAVIADRFCAQAEKLGAKVEKFYLNELDYQGCQGCMACKAGLDHCVLEDGLTQVLEAVRDADVLVMASPIYYWDITAQMKAFLDRTFSYLVPDFMSNSVKTRLAPGKKLVLILVQGNPDPKSFPDLFPKFDYFFKAAGFADNRLIRAMGVNAPGEVAGQEEVMRLADKTAQELCKA